jgi:hypothetical protein
VKQALEHQNESSLVSATTPSAWLLWSAWFPKRQNESTLGWVQGNKRQRLEGTGPGELFPLHHHPALDYSLAPYFLPQAVRMVHNPPHPTKTPSAFDGTRSNVHAQDWLFTPTVFILKQYILTAASHPFHYQKPQH